MAYLLPETLPDLPTTTKIDKEAEEDDDNDSEKSISLPPSSVSSTLDSLASSLSSYQLISDEHGVDSNLFGTYKIEKENNATIFL